MQIAVPREIAPGEKRVALTPDVIPQLIEAGHNVLVERGAGDAAPVSRMKPTRRRCAASRRCPNALRGSRDGSQYSAPEPAASEASSELDADQRGRGAHRPASAGRRP